MTQPKLLLVSDSICFYSSCLEENELLMSQTISLNDPASLKRMQIPCRAFGCDHLQCFDYNVFVTLNKENIDGRLFYKCSVCNERRNPDKIYIDFVALAFLKLYNKSDSVKLHRSGAFSASPGGLSAEFSGLPYFNSIFDLKLLTTVPYFRREIIELKQLHYTTVFDIINIINTFEIEKLLSILRVDEATKKTFIQTNGIDSIR